MLSNYFITNFPKNLLVKKFWKCIRTISTKICGLLCSATLL